MYTFSLSSQSHRNLSQLPNFAFSVPLALFHSSQCEGGEGERGDEKLQEALIMFPSVSSLSYHDSMVKSKGVSFCLHCCSYCILCWTSAVLQWTQLS